MKISVKRTNLISISKCAAKLTNKPILLKVKNQIFNINELGQKSFVSIF